MARGEARRGRRCIPAGSCSRTCRRSARSSRLREELAGSPFGMVETLEVLQRTWHVDGQSVRPDHRMVAHTGFLTHARLLAPDLTRRGRELPRPRRPRRGRGRRLGGVPPRASSARATSWAGLAIGLVVGVLFVPDVADALRGSPPRTRLLASLAFVVRGRGRRRRRSAPRSAARCQRGSAAGAGALRQGDRVAGGAVGVVGVLVLMWLLIPALANSPGWTARAVRDSAVARVIDRVAPAPPSESETLGRLVGDQTVPRGLRHALVTRRGRRRRPTAIPAEAADARHRARP